MSAQRGRRGPRAASGVGGVAVLLALTVGALASDSTAQPGTSGSPGTLAFTKVGADGGTAIHVVSARGGRSRRLSDGGLDDFPAWSPDGRQIAFSSLRGDTSQIYLMKADGSGERRLTAGRGSATDPAWSPDGTRIAFTRVAEGSTGDIHVIGVDGRGETQLTDADTPTHGIFSYDDQAAWSPDGTRIAFISNRDVDLDYEIWVMNADGSAPVRLTRTRELELDKAPAWSPDGSLLAFSRGRGDRTAIWTMRPDGNAARRLRTRADEPAWSPDGRRIAYTSFRNASADVYTMRADGRAQVRVTRFRQAELEPAWRPQASR